jgi:hypothetical protein
MEKIELVQVHYMPMDLKPGCLYVSEVYNVAAHLCPCGCDTKVVTPIGPTEWTFTIDDGRSTFFPSLGNWQPPCRSHYWIIYGEIEWSYQWSENQIKAGRDAELNRRKEYYERVEKRRRGLFAKMTEWILR